MSAMFPGQHEDEKVELVFRQHPIVARKFLIYGLAVITVALLPLAIPAVYFISGLPGLLFMILAGVCVVVFLVWLWRWIGWYYSVYILTDRRLVCIKQSGLFDRSVTEWQLDKVYNVNYHVGGFQATIFGFGDITIKTAIGEYVMTKIHKPAEIHRRIMLAVKEARPQDAASYIDNSAAIM